MSFIENYISWLGDKSCLGYGKATNSISRIDRYYFNDINFHMPHLNNLLYKLIENMGHSMNGTKTSITNLFFYKIINFFVPRRKYLLNNFNIYKGSAWFCLCFKHVEYIVNFLMSKEGIKYFNSFKYSFIGDEIFFQTLLLNSPYKDEVLNDILRFVKWNGFLLVL